MLPTLLPAVQADLQASDTATATGTWNFIRSFGVIGGISIPTTIFNNQFDRLSSLIRNPAVRASLSHGRAYSHVSRDFIKSFPNPLRDEIIGAYSESIKLVWQVAISFTGLTFLLVFLEMEIKLRTELETEYGRKEKPSKLPLATERPLAKRFNMKAFGHRMTKMATALVFCRWIFASSVFTSVFRPPPHSSLFTYDNKLLQRIQ